MNHAITMTAISIVLIFAFGAVLQFVTNDRPNWWRFGLLLSSSLIMLIVVASTLVAWMEVR